MPFDFNLIIDRLGGTAETARLCEVSAPAVSGWRKHGIPKARLQFLHLARPEIFMKPDARVCHSTEGHEERFRERPAKLVELS